ncbi:hypothetical protein LCGC14_2885150, partial [marine sediment metagenome]
MPEDGTSSANTTQQSPPADATPSQAPSGQAPPDPAQPRDPSTGQFQSPDPTWAEGKSREEVVALAQQVFQQLPQLQQQQQAPTPQVAPVTTQSTFVPTPVTGAPDPDLQYSDPAAYQHQQDAHQTALIQQQVQTIGQAALGPLYQNQAMVNRRMVEQDSEYREVFSKFGHEIDAQVASVPFEQRTIDAYQWVANQVRGVHWKEFAYDAQQRSSPDSVTVSVGDQPIPGADPVYRDPLDEFWASDHAYVRAAKVEGLTKSDIRDQVGAMGL